jgi:CBS domain-containing membrane protein
MESKMSIQIPRKIGDIMTSDVVTIGEDDSLEHIGDAMKAMKFRHMPVVDGPNLVGLITKGVLLAASASSLLPLGAAQTATLSKRFHVRDIMTRDVVTVYPEMPLDEAAHIMVRGKYGCLPVVTPSNRLVGIVTEADFVKLAVILLKTHPQTQG